MKTKIQYPTGLSITIEYDANEANQLPEVDKFTAEAISYQHRDLLDEVAALKRLIDMYQKELIKLKEEIVELNKLIVPSDAVHAKTDEHEEAIVMANALREKTEHSFKNVAPEKSAPKWRLRKCIVCGGEYQPNGPRGNTCPDCKGAVSSFVNEKPATEGVNAELDEALKEIEEALKEIEELQKQPYTFLP